MITHGPQNSFPSALLDPGQLQRHVADVVTREGQGRCSEDTCSLGGFTDRTCRVGATEREAVFHFTRPRASGLKIDSAPLSWQRLAARRALSGGPFLGPPTLQWENLCLEVSIETQSVQSPLPFQTQAERRVLLPRFVSGDSDPARAPSWRGGAGLGDVKGFLLVAFPPT